MPGSVSALSTTAPAPSPNSTQVVRSLQSTMRVSVYAPTTSTVLALPVRMNLSATDSAYTKPEHAALTSRSEEHTSELQSLMRISYAVFCLKKIKHKTNNKTDNINRGQTRILKQEDK